MQYLRRRANLAWSEAGLPSYSYVFDVVVNGIAGKNPTTPYFTTNAAAENKRHT